MQKTYEIEGKIKSRHFNWLELLAAGIVASFATIALFAFLAYIFFDFALLTNSSCAETNKMIYCFYSEDWDDSTYLSTITSFYSTVIVFLVVIITIISGISFFIIRHSSKQEIEEAVETELPKYFEKIKSIEHLERILKSIVERHVPKRHLESVNDQIEDMREAVDYADECIKEMKTDIKNIKSRLD